MIQHALVVLVLHIINVLIVDFQILCNMIELAQDVNQEHSFQIPRINVLIVRIVVFHVMALSPQIVHGAHLNLLYMMKLTNV